ncbi:NADH dehydrogenase [ubiquinone] flavoprotein 3, mitochondrial [Popillia japonica]|uniref:NADH dehydrogenase [ubiquinone] flavoprotein 3, mitochondrial n=1 Tax=Popillia japonica TaxID=7064 RepID=A0AAW1N5U2_POPJA
MASFRITYSTLKSTANLCNSLTIRRGFSSDVKGLSAKVVHPANEPVGPGAAKTTNYKNPEYFCYGAKVVHPANEPVGPGAAKTTNYKNPEYFCYDKDSFFEAEVEMASYRCPQPSNKK